MINTITFNGISSDEFDVYVGGQNSFNAPKKNIKKIPVPGRNGDLVFDKGTFNNVNIAYNIVGVSNFKERINDIKEWLTSPRSYARLEDTYNPDYYRLGMVTAGITFTMKHLNQYGKAKVTFDCKPQRFLKSGEEIAEFEVDGTILNPTEFPSDPVITVYGSGSGTVVIGSQTITIDDIDTYTVIDCDLQDCYNAHGNRNNHVALGAYGDYPQLIGETSIDFSGGVDSVSIKGNWWTI